MIPSAVARLAQSITYDLRYAFRTLLKNPAFSIAAILLLAIGISGTTLAFSVVNAILLRELPVRSPGELARVVTLMHNRPPVSEYPYRVFDEWRRRSRSFAAAFAQTNLDISYSDAQGSRPVQAQIVTGNYYDLLGVQPLLGRLLTQQDEWAKGDDLPVVLTYRIWDRRFHRDWNVLGKIVHLEGRPFTVVGVTKAGFNGTSVDTGPDLQVPFISGEFLTASGSKKGDPRSCCFWEIGGRLRPDVTIAQSQVETSQAMQAAYEAVFSTSKPLTERNRRWIQQQRLRVEPLNRGVSWLRQRFSSQLYALMGAATLLLLLACGNVAGLLLTRAAAQEQQNAIRLAVGASRWRLTRQWLIEGAVLAFFGGAGGLLITCAALPFLDALLPPMRDIMTQALPPALHVSLDFRLFTFAVLVSCAVSILAALSPAWYAARADLSTALKSANSSRRNTHIRGILVGAQVAICTIVMVNTDLMLMTLRNFETLNPGFRRDHIITFTVDTALQKYDVAQTYGLALRLYRNMSTLPGVAGTSVAVKPLLRGAGMRLSVTPIDGRRSAIEELNSDSNVVSPGYFETLGIRLMAGRTFDDHDLGSTKPVPVVVNETFVKQFFPETGGIGQRFDYASDDSLTPRYEVVGVVADSKYRSLREAPFPAVYTCMKSPDDISQSSFQLIARTFVDPASIISEAQKTLHAIDPRLPFSEIHTMREDLNNSLWSEHTLVRLGLLFSALSILLTAIGLYGLLSYVVVERSREIGIRMALGAQRADILRAIGFRTMGLVALGTTLGLAGSLATATLLRNLLFEVSPWSVQALVLSAVVVAGCAALATMWPAVRAARLDPSTTLRHGA